MALPPPPPTSSNTSKLIQWNALVSEYSKNRLFLNSLNTFSLLLSTTSLLPDKFTVPSVLRSCAALADARLGKSVHAISCKLQLTSDTYVNNALISMYMRCGRVTDARKVFEEMPERNLVSWNAMLGGYFENGMVEEGFGLLREMTTMTMLVDDATVVTVLPVCGAEGWVEMGQLVHGLAVKLGLEMEVRVCNALVDMYSKCGWLAEARRMFMRMVVGTRNVVSWNAMIGGCTRNGDTAVAFDVLREMAAKANEVTMLNVLPGCLDPSEMRRLRELHGYAIRNELTRDELVSNAFIAAYAKCGSVTLAMDVFSGMEERRTVNSWNAMVGGCAQNGDPRKAVDLFLEMIASGLKPDRFSVGSLLLACTHLKCLWMGKSIHGFVQRNGLEMDSFLHISLISLYVQCGELLIARALFDAVEKRDVVSWNAMIAGYSQNELPEETLELFRQMQQDGFCPTRIATTSALVACAQISALRIGKELHCFALKANFTEDPHVASSIIDMYAKCGSLEQSCNLFDRSERKDLVSWNVMIMGYGIHGRAAQAIELLDRMQKQALEPDAFTYLGILMACSHAGLLEEGLQYFEEMRNKHRIQPKLEHYSCVVDMLGRAGRLSAAMRLVEEMPDEPDSRIWSALLSACRIHGDMDLGERIAERLLALEPDKVEHYVMASNLFAGSGRWDDVRRIRKKLKENGLQKDPGCSWIELGGKVYSFMVADQALQELSEIKHPHES